MFGVGTSLGAVISLAGGLHSPASAGDRVTYPVAQETVGHVQMDSEHPDTCTMTNRSPSDLNVIMMQDIHPQYASWEVSDEAFWAVANVVDCIRTNQISGQPMGMEGHSIRIYGSYQVASSEGLRVFATVEWEYSGPSPERHFELWEFLLVEGGESYTIEGYSRTEPTQMLQALAGEGRWNLLELRDFAQGVMPQSPELGGLNLIFRDDLRVAVQAIYAVDTYSVEGEEVTDVIYVTDDEVQAIIKVSSVSGDWTLAVNLTHGLLNFTYLGDDSQVGRVAQSLNVTLAQAQAYLTAAGF